MQNIAVSFVKLGQYNDAVTALEHIMVEEPTFRTGLNLILCYYALRDKDKMKRTFDRLLTVEMNVDDEHKYSASPVSNQSIQQTMSWYFCLLNCYHKMKWNTSRNHMLLSH